jgi:cyclophilin family peptidyl-prolyl cis-trans isomerase
MPETPELAVLETNLGRIIIEFKPDQAPDHVANFVKLAKSGFYDGVRFHRVIPGFMIQGGDPNTKNSPRSMHGTGGPGYEIEAEFNDVTHDRGIVSMARKSEPNSAGSQFFIMHAHRPQLDNQYTVFGEVVEGIAVVDAIADLPRDERDNPLEANPAIIERVTFVAPEPSED